MVQNSVLIVLVTIVTSDRSYSPGARVEVVAGCCVVSSGVVGWAVVGSVVVVLIAVVGETVVGEAVVGEAVVGARP